MRRLIFGLILATAGGVASAQPPREAAPARTIQCIEVDGRNVPAACLAPASRIDGREYICTCPKGGQRVEVAVCGKGQAPPPESRALNEARAAAIKDGSLLGDTFEGRPICAVPRAG